VLFVGAFARVCPLQLRPPVLADLRKGPPTAHIIIQCDVFPLHGFFAGIMTPPAIPTMPFVPMARSCAVARQSRPYSPLPRELAAALLILIANLSPQSLALRCGSEHAIANSSPPFGGPAQAPLAANLRPRYTLRTHRATPRVRSHWQSSPGSAPRSPSSCRPCEPCRSPRSGPSVRAARPYSVAPRVL
jgi:hypothetical protein